MVSVIIPTHNRPEMLKKAVFSVLAQTYGDLEVIVVDDGIERRATEVINHINDSRIRYIAHDKERGGSAARNTGIRVAHGEYIAFLDDDDEWMPNKLKIQMGSFADVPDEVGFCFSAVTNVFPGHDRVTVVPAGINDYFHEILGNLKGFLTVTLIIKKSVFDDVGLFDELLPSHQEADLILRITKKYKGLGINQPLVRVNMSVHDSVGQNLNKKIAGREMIIKKYFADFKKEPSLLAVNYFLLGLFYRDNKQYLEAQNRFKLALATDCQFRYFLHYISMSMGAMPYRYLRQWIK